MKVGRPEAHQGSVSEGEVSVKKEGEESEEKHEEELTPGVREVSGKSPGPEEEEAARDSAGEKKRRLGQEVRGSSKRCRKEEGRAGRGLLSHCPAWQSRKGVERQLSKLPEKEEEKEEGVEGGWNQELRGHLQRHRDGSRPKNKKEDRAP